MNCFTGKAYKSNNMPIEYSATLDARNSAPDNKYCYVWLLSPQLNYSGSCEVIYTV